MTIWSKINPFHARPSSALSSAPPPPRSSGLDDRPWSAMDHPDSVHELLYDREETLRTPVPLRSLESRHTTPRKGGISHSLKHHPSLAVLRGRFKRNNEDDTRGSFSASGWRAESPAMIKDRSGSRATERSATTEGRSSRASRGAIGGPSPGKRLIRKLSLRRMKSVPRELNGVSVHGDPPPVPNKYATLSVLPARATRRQAVTPTLELTRAHTPDAAATPESGRIRLNVSIELEGAGLSPTRYASSSRGSYRSQRAQSTPAASPVVQRIMPLSEMNDLSPSRLSLPPQLAFTQGRSVTRQHPHPAPLPPRRPSMPATRLQTPADTTTRRSSTTESILSDFEPISLRSGMSMRSESTASRAMGLDEEAELFFGGSAHEAEETLQDSPDAEDQQQGDALLSFEQLDDSPDTPISTAAPSPAAEGLSTTPRFDQAKADRRSSSPYEVKLAPSALKRVSLDAFGKPSPLSQSSSTQAFWETIHEEETPSRAGAAAVADVDAKMDDQGIIDFDKFTESGDVEAETVREDQWPLSDFHPTQLSTIDEISSSCGMSTDPAIVAHLRQLTADTVNRSRLSDTDTPPHTVKRKSRVSTNSAGGDESPFVPPRSAKGSDDSVTQALVSVQQEHLRSLEAELKAAIEEVERLRDEIWEKEASRQAEIQRRNQAGEVALEAKGRVEQMLEEKAALLEELESYRTALEEAGLAQNDDDQVHQQLEHIQAQLLDVQDQHSQLQEDYAKLEEELEDLRDVRHTDAQTLASSQQRQADLEERLEAAQLKMLDLQTQLRIQDDEHDQQINEVVEVHQDRIGEQERDLRAVRSQLEEALRAKEQVQANMQAQLDTLQQYHKDHIRGLETELLAVERSRTEMGEWYMTAKYERNELRVEVARLKEAREGAERGAEIAKVEADRVCAEMDRLVEYKEELEAENDDLHRQLELWATSWDQGRGHKREIAELQRALEKSEHSLARAEDRFAEVGEILETKGLEAQDTQEKIRWLTARIEEYEDERASSLRKSQRQEDDTARMREDLEDQLAVAKTQLRLQTIALEAAVTDSEVHKSTVWDLRSRLDAYLTELDRVKLSETTLQSQMTDLRRNSADDEMRRLELEKRIKALEADKELLNVALESKETELALTQRRVQRGEAGLAGSTPLRTAKTGMSGSVSTSKIARRSDGTSPLSTGAKRLSTSLSTGALSSSKKMGPPTTPSAPRGRVRDALGEATLHNTPAAPRTPERIKAGKREITLSSSVKRRGPGEPELADTL